MKVSRRKLAIATVEQLRTNPDRRKVVESLAAYLIANKMTHQLELLLGDIARLLAEKEGHVLADVTSAFALNTETRSQIEAYLRKATGAKQIELNESVDPDLLGGFTLRTPDRELDASVRHKLNQLQIGA